jgi:hypothetical protein
MHADAIANIASIAARELVIETNLKDIENVWMEMKLDLERYKRTYKIKSLEQVNDALDSHQLMLSSHKNSIFYFRY